MDIELNDDVNSLKPKIIFFAPILEYPPAGGPQMSVINAIKALSQISELHIITNVPVWRLGENAIEFIEEHSHALEFAPTSILNSKIDILDRIMRRLKREFLRPIVAISDVRFVIKYAAKHDINIFWIDRVLEHAFSVFKLLRRKKPHALIIGDTEAVHSRFVLREIPMIKNPFRKALVSFKGNKIVNEEKELVTTANVVTAVSELDADYYRSLAPNPETIKLFSNIVDVDDYTGEFTNLENLKKPYVLLLGSFGHINSPMDRAAKWVVEDIMPLVLKQVPNAHVYIIGRNSDKTLAHYNSDAVRVLGRVPSMLPYLKESTASLVPLHYESGTRFKILESGAASIPCISTTLGAEGIQVTNEDNILIADTTEDFANAMVKVFQDSAYAGKMGRNLHKLIQEQYSLKTQKRDGESIISYLERGQV